MKYDKHSKLKNKLHTIFILIIIIFCIFGINKYIEQLSAISNKEGIKIAEQSIRNATVSCYSIDSAYPATYENLLEKSGLVADVSEEYTVFYEIFASNIMPIITVIERQ